MDIIEKLTDLHKQATTERSHFYVASCCADAIAEFVRLRDLLAETVREREEWNGKHQLACIQIEQMRPVVRAACGVVGADTYKHPILSREDAVKAGVAALHDAVGRWQSAQPASTQAKEAT